MAKGPGERGIHTRSLSKMQKPMQEVIPGGVKRYETAVTSFQPEQNTVSTAESYLVARKRRHQHRKFPSSEAYKRERRRLI
jgi:hypothetical protein